MDFTKKVKEGITNRGRKGIGVEVKAKLVNEKNHSISVFLFHHFKVLHKTGVLFTLTCVQLFQSRVRVLAVCFT